MHYLDKGTCCIYNIVNMILEGEESFEFFGGKCGERYLDGWRRVRRGWVRVMGGG